MKKISRAKLACKVILALEKEPAFYINHEILLDILDNAIDDLLFLKSFQVILD